MYVPPEYDDLVVVEKFHQLNKALEVLSTVHAKTVRSNPASPPLTPMEKYAYCCTVEKHPPCVAFTDFMVDTKRTEAATEGCAPLLQAMQPPRRQSVRLGTAEWEAAEGAPSDSPTQRPAARNGNGTGGGTLDLCRSYVGRAALLSIFAVLPECVHLNTLILRQQYLSSGMVELLCAALQPLPHVASLDVSYNPCGCKGVNALIRLVRRKKTIVRCDVRGVEAIAPLTRRLEEAVQHNRQAIPKADALQMVPEDDF